MFLCMAIYYKIFKALLNKHKSEKNWMFIINEQHTQPVSFYMLNICTEQRVF